MAMCLHEYVILLAKCSQHHPPDCVKGQWKEAMMNRAGDRLTSAHLHNILLEEENLNSSI